MFKINTNLPTGEHNVSVYSLKLQCLEEQPIFSMVLANEAGEQVTISTKLDAFGIHQSKMLVNNLIDDFNLLLLDGKEEYNGESLPIMPVYEFRGYEHYNMIIETLEEALKEFEAVLKINLTNKRWEPLEYLEMVKINA